MGSGEIDKLLEGLKRAPRAVADDIAGQLLANARRFSRVRTGAMRRGWAVRVQGAGEGFAIILSNTQEYAAYQDPDVPARALAAVKIDLDKVG